MPDFGSRLNKAFDQYGQLCLGIDPHPAVLKFHGLEDSAHGAEELAYRVIEHSQGEIGILKPQIALFERFGAVGYAVLERIFERVRSTDVLLIADVKRGEIGSSMAGYTAAWLGADSPLRADAITVNPYLGVGALAELFHHAAEHGQGIFVLAANSNPESFTLQQHGTPSVVSLIIDEVVAASRLIGSGHAALSHIGLVIGATVELGDYGIDSENFLNLPILAPGFGYQGAQLSDLSERFGTKAGQVLVAQSRSLLMTPWSNFSQDLRHQQEEIRTVLERGQQ